MKKISLSLFLISMAFAFVIAQQPYATIKGHVYNHETRNPVAGQTIIIATDSLNSAGYPRKVITDETGFYADKIPFKPGSTQMAISVSTYDCNGTLLSSTGYAYINSPDITLDFLICSTQNRECVAMFKAQPASNNLMSFAFMDGSSTSSGADIFSYSWNFGDSTTSTEKNPVHTFAQPGVYNVCLNIVNKNDSLCSSSFCLPVEAGTISPGSCENSFWYYHDSISNYYVFIGSTSNGQAVDWTWDFGDGTTASGQKVSHSFNTDANTGHTVCLTTTGINPDGSSCSFNSCQQIYFYNPSPCETSFSYKPDSTGLGYTFSGYSKNNSINSWIWDFGDGTTATGQNVSHYFGTDATTIHYVCLTTYGVNPNGDTCSYNSCQKVYNSSPSPCQNNFQAYSEGNLTYTFSGNLNYGTQAYYYWDFGDGDTAAGQQVTHTFRGTKAEIFYNVCLTTIVYVPGTTGFYECKSISCQVIYPANDLSCRAAMSAEPDSTKYTYRFYNLSQSKHSYSFWDFGDGNQSFEQNPVHTYLSPGLYIACLTISDSLNNCWNQSCMEIWVDMIQYGCKASFYTISSDSAANPGTFMFINTSTESVYSNLKWSFGDGNSSTDLNPVHTYATPGIYKACLTIWDSSGSCKSSYCTEIFTGKPISNNIISGNVMAGNNVADKGIVWLISPDNSFYSESNIDSSGTYIFRDVPAGSYYIYAMLTPGSSLFFSYMPTYYKSSVTWQEATLVTTGEPNSWFSINLVPATHNSQGNASISGSASWTDASGSPISPAHNVEIVLYNSIGEPVAYTFTGVDGTYLFNDLPYGEYTIQAEMAGKNTQALSISLSQDSAVTNINFMVDKEANNILAIGKYKSSQLLTGNPYPNPVEETLNIVFNAISPVTAIIEIINMQGQILRSESKEIPGGKNIISITTGNLKKGIYLLNIKMEGQEPVQKRFIR